MFLVGCILYLMVSPRRLGGGKWIPSFHNMQGAASPASFHLILYTNKPRRKVWFAPFPATAKAQRGGVSYLQSHSLKAGEQEASPVWPTSMAGRLLLQVLSTP